MKDLNLGKQAIYEAAKEVFDRFLAMSKDERRDDKERTGIQVLVWEPGTRNKVTVSVYEPSEAAQFFANEKAVRIDCFGHTTSQESADPDLCRYAGAICIPYGNLPSVVIKDDESKLIISTSGLKAEEDVAVSAAVGARLFGETFSDICDCLYKRTAAMPDWYLEKIGPSQNAGYFEFLFAKRYWIGNRPEDMELIEDYFGWLPASNGDWERLAYGIDKAPYNVPLTIVNPADGTSKEIFFDQFISPDAFPDKFFSEERAKKWHLYAIISETESSKRFIIPVH